MKTTSLDLRRRIVETYDEGKWTQEEVAERFRVSHGMVKKLVMQKKKTGASRRDIVSRGGRPGCCPSGARS